MGKYKVGRWLTDTTLEQSLLVFAVHAVSNKYKKGDTAHVLSTFTNTFF